MPKCFITGVEVPLDNAYVLDLRAAHRALKDLRQRVAALERLIEQLSPKDDVEVHDNKTDTTRVRSDRRLVTETVARALCVAHPDGDLFVSWPEFRARRASIARGLLAAASAEATPEAAPGPGKTGTSEPAALQGGEPHGDPT